MRQWLGRFIVDGAIFFGLQFLVLIVVAPSIDTSSVPDWMLIAVATLMCSWAVVLLLAAIWAAWTLIVRYDTPRR